MKQAITTKNDYVKRFCCCFLRNQLTLHCIHKLDISPNPGDQLNKRRENPLSLYLVCITYVESIAAEKSTFQISNSVSFTFHQLLSSFANYHHQTHFYNKFCGASYNRVSLEIGVDAHSYNIPLKRIHFSLSFASSITMFHCKCVIS